MTNSFTTCNHEDAPCCGCGTESGELPENYGAPGMGDDLNEFPDDDGEDDETPERDVDDSMDGDHDSAMASAGFGTDEDYGYYGGDEY